MKATPQPPPSTGLIYNQRSAGFARGGARTLGGRGPKTGTLPVLTEEWLGEAIFQRRWGRYLPSERQLALELQISRAVLRLALSRLEKKGWIRKIARAKTIILRKSRVKPPRPERKLILVCPVGASEDYPAKNFDFYGKLLRHSLEKKIPVLEIRDGRLDARNAKAVLDRHIAANPGCVWLAAGTSAEVQRHLERKRVTTILVGHRFPGIELCAVDMDTNAACWHAVTRLAVAGCRSVNLISRDAPLAGEKAAEEGFWRAAQAYPDVQARIHRLNPAKEVKHLLATLIARPFQPAGFVVIHPLWAVRLFCAALSQRLHWRRDIRIISIFDDPVLNTLPEKIPHYSRTNFFDKISELTVRALRGEVLKPKEYLFVPEFIGEKYL